MAQDNLRPEAETLPVVAGHTHAVRALLIMMAAKHRPTYIHLRQVAAYTEGFARAVGLPEEEVRVAHLAGLLHDIGKVAITEAILVKPGRLDEHEVHEMRSHPEWGFEILGRIGEFDEVRQAVLTHHEWWNGRGYPVGLGGDQIPLIARLIGIADAFDTMTTPRPYRQPMPDDFAMAELVRCSGTQFDPILVPEFVTWIQSRPSGLDLVSRGRLRKAGAFVADIEPLALRAAR